MGLFIVQGFVRVSVAEVILECAADVSLVFQNGGAEVLVHQADYESSVRFNGSYQAVLWGSEIGASPSLDSFFG
jgi:hypothetical protein